MPITGAVNCIRWSENGHGSFHSSTYDAYSINPPSTVIASFNYQTQEMEESVTDGCSILKNDSKCRIKSEQQDGVDVILNFMETNFERLRAAPHVIDGPLRSTTVDRDWWQIDRSYSCTNGQEAYTFDRTLIDELASSAKMTGDAMSYSANGVTSSYIVGAEPVCAKSTCRIKNEAGVGSYKTCSADTSGTQTCPTAAGETVVTACTCECIQKICKVKTPATEVAITDKNTLASDVKSDVSLLAAQFIYSYKDCLIDAADNATCPTEGSDIVVSDCSCDDERAMGEASAALGAISAIKKDSICSKTPAPAK